MVRVRVAVVAVLLMVSGCAGPGQVASPPSPTAATSPGLSATSTPSSSSAAPPSASVTTRDSLGCATEPGEKVDCALPHRYEYFANSYCLPITVMLWMGGSNGLDVPLVEVVAAKERGTCRARFPVAMTRSAEGVLTEPGWASLRKCADADAKTVRCDKPHMVEYLGAEEDAEASQGDCENSAEAYLGVPIDQRAGELSVRPNAVWGTAKLEMCAIEVRGSRELNDTLRTIGDAPLPYVS